MGVGKGREQGQGVVAGGAKEEEEKQVREILLNDKKRPQNALFAFFLASSLFCFVQFFSKAIKKQN